MLGHYLSIAVRNLSRDKLHTTLAVTVLALGLVCFIAAALFDLHLDSFDRQFRNHDRTYVVYQSVDWPLAGQRASRGTLGTRAAPAMAEQLETDIPELVVARFYQSVVTVSVDGGAGSFRRAAYVDPEFFAIFDFDVVAGSLTDALVQPGTAILSESAATQLFGSGVAAIGRILTIVEQGVRVELTVTAVTREIVTPSHLALGRFAVSFEIFAPSPLFEEIYVSLGANAKSWTFLWATVYAMLPEDGPVTAHTLNAQLRAYGERELPDRGARVAFEARPLTRLIRDRVQQRLQISAALPIEVTALLLWFAGLILGIACLNFVNLTTARSAARAREIGDA